MKGDVSVGIVKGSDLKLMFKAHYEAGGVPVTGSQTVRFHEGMVCWNGRLVDELLFTPREEGATFSIEDVTIGIDFHWERKERQEFRGSLRVCVEDGMLRAVNILPVEEYLVSVISSEMSATSSPEFLKAHAVIARSWLLSQKDVHKGFDVCADDHCQRYQGISRISTPAVTRAVEETRGEVLWHDGQICDARYSKCCGGALEEFETCWEDVHHPYLTGKRDSLTKEAFPDLTKEDVARDWILSSPASFCNTEDGDVLSQILNGYDQETNDFFRWTVEYSQDELTALVGRRLGDDLGEVLGLIPLRRGRSGRICELKIVGSKKSVVIGKELAIRRALSESHLKSSAFVADFDEHSRTFTLRGAGWGHGVGLCQIGAAVMGAKGYKYNEILGHYYPDTEIRKIYD